MTTSFLFFSLHRTREKDFQSTFRLYPPQRSSTGGRYITERKAPLRVSAIQYFDSSSNRCMPFFSTINTTTTTTLFLFLRLIHAYNVIVVPR